MSQVSLYNGYKCPECGGSMFGTSHCTGEDAKGHCHSYLEDGSRCQYTWKRPWDDHKVFTDEPRGITFEKLSCIEPVDIERVFYAVRDKLEPVGWNAHICLAAKGQFIKKMTEYGYSTNQSSMTRRKMLEKFHGDINRMNREFVISQIQDVLGVVTDEQVLFKYDLNDNGFDRLAVSSIEDVPLHALYEIRRTVCGWEWSAEYKEEFVCNHRPLLLEYWMKNYNKSLYDGSTV